MSSTRTTLALALLLALAGCRFHGYMVLDGDKLEFERTKVRERVPERHWVQVECLWEEGVFTRWTKFAAGVRISLPRDVTEGVYVSGEDCKIEVAPMTNPLSNVLNGLAWTPATEGTVQVTKVNGGELRARFDADTKEGPVYGRFVVKRGG